VTYAVFANVAESRLFRIGAKVRVLDIHGTALLCEGLSIGGCTIRAYIRAGKLRSFRAKWVNDARGLSFGEREEMELVARNLTQQGQRLA
jgi:hypothetical protein